MDPAVLIALQSLNVPEWFPPACAQPATPGYALVAVHDRPRADAVPGSAVLWIEPDGTLRAREQELAGWLRGPLPEQPRELEGARWYRLSDTALPYRFDPCTQVLWIAPARDTQQLSFGGDIPGVLKSAQPGGFLNLDLFAADSENSSTRYAGLAELGMAAGFGALRSSWSADREDTRRLETFVTFDNPEKLQRLRVGDGITRIDGLGTAVRYGGVRWGTDFSLQPEVPRFALPGVSGDAALPSTVELYVDGVLRDRREVDPGPFAVNNPPVFTGSGNLQVVVRDTLGRETLYVQPFYVSTTSLAAGVSDYAIEMGRLRENFGFDGDRYSDRFAIGSYRYGFSDRVTAGARLEVQEEAHTLGASTVLTAPGIGQFNAALALSDGEAGSGRQLTLGYERVARGLSLGLQGSWSDPEYVELGRTPGAIARALRAQAGFALPGGGGLSLAWAEEVRRDRDAIELTALTYSQPVLGWYGTLSWLRSPQAGNSTLLGFSRPLARGHSLSLQFQRDAQGENLFMLTWQFSPSGPLGWSSLATASGGDQRSSTASLGYGSTRGNARLTTAEIDGNRTHLAEFNTGLAWLDGDLYWTRPVRESFAVADASAPGVRIYRDNQLAGVTGANGRALIPDLRTYNTTRISLDTQDLPLDRGLTEASQDIKLAPGGALITLASPVRRLLELKLRQDSGEPVPAGAQLKVSGQPADLPVGFDGLIYLEAPAAAFTLQAGWSKGQCQTDTLEPDALPAEIPCR